MTRGELAKSVRELGELMERFVADPDVSDHECDLELLSLSARVENRLGEIRRVVKSGRPDSRHLHPVPDDDPRPAA